jgi:hypothetical protein
VSTAWLRGLGRTRTVRLTVTTIFWIFAHQVLDTMPAKTLNSNFEKLPVWFVNILDKGSKGIFVEQKDEVLKKS